MDGEINLQNEFRAGADLSPVDFKTDVDFSSGIVYSLPTIAQLTSPLVTFQPQGRDTRTYQFSDNASLMAGNHALQFGGSLQRTREPVQLRRADPQRQLRLHWRRAAQQPPASRHQRGRPHDREQPPEFAVGHDYVTQSDVSGRKPDIGVRRRSPEQPELEPGQWLDVHPGQLAAEAESHRSPRAQVGYFSPVSEDDNLAFVRVLDGRTISQALLDPTTTVSFANGDLWKQDLNNFGPAVGIAWIRSRTARHRYAPGTCWHSSARSR